MKIALTAILAICLLSCSGSKKAIETKPKPKKEVVVAEVTNDEGEIQEMVEVIDTKGNTVAEVSSHQESEKIMKKKDSVSSLVIHQNVSKRFYENHELWDELLGKYVSETGKVDYKGFQKDSIDLSTYINMLKMGYFKIDEYSRQRKLAYWINAYNALTVDLILRNYPLNSIKDIKDPWDQRLWKFGDQWLNLNDIEHKILRKMDEPRIHFAIVCASESCPKLLNKTYSANNLEEQLSIATKDFLSDASKNELSENSIKLSKIFKWFAKDFKTDGSIIDFLNQYSEVTINENAKKSYKDYSWDLNQ